MIQSRRKFLFQVGTSSLLLSNPVLSSLSRFSSTLSPEKKLGVALVGLGNYSSGQLAPALQQTKHCTLTGIVTGTPLKAERWKAQYNIPDGNIYSYETFDRIADNKAIDVVYIVLPNSMHHEFTIRAAKAGKHVFCEKPMGLSVKECDEMIDACNKAGVRLFIGYRLHSDPFHQAAMKFRTTGVGRLNTIESEFAFVIGDPAQWRLNKSLAGGGALMDLGIYCIQAARYSTGEEPVSVFATEEKTDVVKFKEVDETIRWQMDFKSGIVAQLMTSYNLRGNRLKITAENGWFELDPAYYYGGIKGRTDKGDLNFININQQAAQMDNFSSRILDHGPSDADGEEGKKDLKVIEAIYRSIATGVKVSV